MVALGKKSIGGLSFRKKSSTPTQEVLGRQKQKKSTTSTQHKHQHTDKTPRHSNTKFVLTDKRHDYSDDESSVSHSSSSSPDDYDESYDDESRFTYDDSVVVGRNGIRDMSVKDEHDDELNRCGTSWDDDEQQDNAFFEKSVKVETQQAVVKVVEHGNIEKLVLEANSFVPKCSEPGDVVIKVDCSTITLQDCMVRRGKWTQVNSLPYTPGTDIVGTIVELGSPELESRFKVGMRVAAIVPSGGNAKFAKVKARNILRVPNGVDPVMALCISSTYVPAKQSLELTRSAGTPLTGANVLVIGANGPTALATIDLAAMEGANVYVTADERHHDHLLSLGVKECFPVNPQGWLPRLGGKMDVVIDSVCFDGYDSSAKALAPKGKLVCTGMSATFTQGRIDGPLGFGDFRSWTASYQKFKVKHRMRNTFLYDKVESFTDEKAIYDQFFKYLCHIHTKGQIKPAVGARASLTMVGSFQKAIERGDAPYGVCVTTPWLTKEEVWTKG